MPPFIIGAKPALKPIRSAKKMRAARKHQRYYGQNDNKDFFWLTRKTDIPFKTEQQGENKAGYSLTESKTDPNQFMPTPALAPKNALQNQANFQQKNSVDAGSNAGSNVGSNAGVKPQATIFTKKTHDNRPSKKQGKENLEKT